MTFDTSAGPVLTLRAQGVDLQPDPAADMERLPHPPHRPHSTPPGDAMEREECPQQQQASKVQPFCRTEMLELLRHVPLPVVVVTAALPTEDGDVSVRGITCSSFCSISLDPPLVSVCVFRTSSFLDVLRRTSSFAIHLLHDGNKALADKFARKHPELNKATFGSYTGVDWELLTVAPVAGAEAGAEPEAEGAGAWELSSASSCSRSLVPVLHGTQAALVCSRKTLTSLGDHVMIVGQVMSHDIGAKDTLIYMNRAYHHVGDIV